MTFVGARLAAEAVEEIRVAWEQEVAEFPPGPLRPIEGVVLTPAQAPRTTRVAAEAATRLGISPPTTVLCATSTATRGTAHDWSLYVAPNDIATFDDAALTALVGHAFASATWASRPGTFAFDAGSPSAEGYFAFARHLAADRFALVAAGGDIEALSRMMLALGPRDGTVPHGCDLTATLAELNEATLGSAAARLFADTKTGTPTLAIRLFAARRFFDTGLHAELTGRGPGTRDVRALDAWLSRLLSARHGFPGRRAPEPPQGLVATTGFAPGYGVRPSEGEVCRATTSRAPRRGRRV